MLERRVAELEGLLTKLACEKADLACELNEVQDANRVLEESLSEARLKREEAEDTASHLLAEALQKDDGTWSAAAAVPACLWGVNEDDDDSWRICVWRHHHGIGHERRIVTVQAVFGGGKGEGDLLAAPA